MILAKIRRVRCLLANGKSDQSAAFISGFKPHFVITDLPYGIQHNGPLVELLTNALPVWANLLPSGGRSSMRGMPRVMSGAR